MTLGAHQVRVLTVSKQLAWLREIESRMNWVVEIPLECHGRNENQISVEYVWIPPQLDPFSTLRSSTQSGLPLNEVKEFAMS